MLMPRRVALGISCSLLLALASSTLRVSITPAESKLGSSAFTDSYGGGATASAVRADQRSAPGISERRFTMSSTPSPLPTPSSTGTAPAAASVPKPTEWLTAGAAIVTALSILIGGALAYRRLLHTRPFTPLARLELEGKLVNCASKPALHVGITVKNAGSTQLLLDVNYEPMLRVVATSPLAWTEARTGNDGKPREVRWDGGSICDIRWLAEMGCGEAIRDLNQGSLHQTPLPPTSELHKEFLVPVSGNAHAYLLLLTVVACQHIGPGRRYREWQHKSRCTKADKGQRRRRVFWTRTIVWSNHSSGG